MLYYFKPVLICKYRYWYAFRTRWLHGINFSAIDFRNKQRSIVIDSLLDWLTYCDYCNSNCNGILNSLDFQRIRVQLKYNIGIWGLNFSMDITFLCMLTFISHVTVVIHFKIRVTCLPCNSWWNGQPNIERGKYMALYAFWVSESSNATKKICVNYPSGLNVSYCNRID